MDPYKTLGVPRNATPEQIRKAHRAKARRYHPDRNPGDAKAIAKFREVQEAYTLLTNPERRARYDTAGDASPGPDLSALILQTVHTLLTEVLQSVIHSGQDPTRTDLAKALQAAAKTGLTEAEKKRQVLVESRRKLASVKGRFHAPDGDTIPDQMVDALLGDVDRALAGIAAHLRVLERVQDLVRKYTYQTEPAPPSNTAAGSLSELWERLHQMAAAAGVDQVPPSDGEPLWRSFSWPTPPRRP